MIKVKLQDIVIEHLAYTIKVKDIKKSENPKNFVMYVTKDNHYESTLYVFR